MSFRFGVRPPQALRNNVQRTMTGYFCSVVSTCYGYLVAPGKERLEPNSRLLPLASVVKTRRKGLRFDCDQLGISVELVT